MSKRALEIRSASLACLAAAALVSGCGEALSAGTPADTPVSTVVATATATPTAAATERARGTAARRGITVRTARSQFGTILANRSGKAFYLFDKEHSSRSECYSDCATAWPPILTRGRPVARRGVRASLLGTTRRRDGRLQVTYRGRPMYYYIHDAPGRVLCHDVVEFGGRWLVVRPSGRPAPRSGS